MSSKLWDEITYRFPNIKAAAVEDLQPSKIFYSQVKFEEEFLYI